MWNLIKIIYNIITNKVKGNKENMTKQQIKLLNVWNQIKNYEEAHQKLDDGKSDFIYLDWAYTYKPEDLSKQDRNNYEDIYKIIKIADFQNISGRAVHEFLEKLFNLYGYNQDNNPWVYELKQIDGWYYVQETECDITEQLEIFINHFINFCTSCNLRKDY